MPGHMIIAIWRNIWHLSLDKISSSSFTFSLRFQKDIVKLIVLATLGMPGYKNLKWHYQPVEKICVSLQAKNQLHPLCFSGDIAKICKLLILGTLGIPGWTHPKWYYPLVEDFDVYLHAKNKLHYSLLSWNLYFKESCNWLTAFWPITWEPEFC